MIPFDLISAASDMVIEREQQTAEYDDDYWNIKRSHDRS